MLRIIIKFGEPLRQTIGQRRITLDMPEGSTVADLLDELAQRHHGFPSAFRGDDLGRLFPYIFFLNSRPVSPPHFASTRLQEGDVVHLVLPVVGGRLVAPLPRNFYARSAVELAPHLLGKRLVREVGGTLLVGRIVEVEAYLGEEDAASHAFRGLTPRNRSMFGPPGHAYVYLIYGVHHCLNVVTGPEGKGQAVLIRAIEPLAGMEVMRANRGRMADRDLTNGPGKLCQALSIDRRLDGHDLCLRQALWLEDAPWPEEEICAGPRVGVGGDERTKLRPWRYFLKTNPFVSRTAQNRTCLPL